MTPRAEETSGPGLHALLIGVGKSRHPDFPPLRGSSLSARAIQEWLTTSYNNPACPLGSITLLSDEVAGGATMSKVEESFHAWYERCSSHEGNIAFFYFCGHGLQGDDPLLLMEDFDPDLPNPGRGCLDFKRTREGMRGCRARTQLYFVDTDRASPTVDLGSIQGTVLIARRARSLSALSMATYFAATPGEHAFERPRSLSIFTEALLRCFAGSAAIRSADQHYIDMSSLAVALGLEMDELGAELNLRLRPQVDLEGNARFHVFTEPPAVESKVLARLRQQAPSQQKEAPQRSDKKADEGRATKEDAEREHVATHPDDPATIDALDRRPFAQVLAMRIRQARAALDATAAVGLKRKE